MVSPIRVAVIDPHPIFLEGVVQAINRCKELELIAGAINVRDMQYVFQERQFDVLVIDNSIPDFEALLSAVAKPLPLQGRRYVGDLKHLGLIVQEGRGPSSRIWLTAPALRAPV